MIYNIPPGLPSFMLLQPISVTLLTCLNPSHTHGHFFQPLRHTKFMSSSGPSHLWSPLPEKLLS